MIFIMNFSVLDFFKFASRMPQIAQVNLDHQNLSGGRGGGGGEEGHAPDLHRNFLFFFSLAIPGSANAKHE